jgi:uncharacterized RDD family membrane protein YckC
VTVSDRTHYEVIDAEPGASKADLKAAYAAALELAQSAGDTDEVVAVRRAWQVLSDPVQRQRYDEEIGVTARAASVVSTPDVEIVDDEDEDGDLDPEVVDAGSVISADPRPSSVPAFLEQPTLGRRLTASLIDVVTAVALFAATSGIALVAFSGDSARFVALIVLFELWMLALFVIPTARTGQTLGKRFTYIMVVDRETGSLPAAGQVLRRYVVPIVAVPALLQLGAFLGLFFGLSYTMGRDQLSLADRLAKTVVVVARYKPTRSGASA